MVNGYDNTGTKNEFDHSLSIEERASGAIALVLNGGKFDNAEILITPQQAKDLGQTLMRYGVHALTGVDVDGTQTVSEMIRKKLATRVQLMAANLTERQYSPAYIAQEAVDIVLRELF
jgi:ABC-type transporter lipoprotein component MlaA